MIEWDKQTAKLATYFPEEVTLEEQRAFLRPKGEIYGILCRVTETIFQLYFTGSNPMRYMGTLEELAPIIASSMPLPVYNETLAPSQHTYGQADARLPQKTATTKVQPAKPRPLSRDELVNLLGDL